MKLDLHTHTIYSDGELSILGNVNKACDLGIDGIAITDHDNIDSWKEIDENNYPIKVIKGVELSSYHKDDVVHVLGYYLNDGGNYDNLNSFLKKTRQDRLRRLDKIISLLEGMGIFITREDVFNEADGAVARPHIAKAIMKKYPHLSFQDIFDKYLGNDAPAFVPVNKFSTKDAVMLLKDNHCLVVIAHPLLIKKFDYKELLDLGIDGIECYYNYDECDIDDVVHFARENNLIITGGSDFHGSIRNNSIGKAFVDGDDAICFLKKINK